MIALQQRLIVLFLLVAGTSWALHIVTAEWPMGYWLLLGVPLAGLAIILALEYLLLVAVDLQHGKTPPRLRSLAKAWLGELLASPRVFLWAQPFRSRRWSDRPTSDDTRKTGVLLVHGFACNRAIWNPWLKLLTESNTPFVAVSLEPPLTSIDAYADQIGAQVAKLHATTGKAPVVVAHSMGGLAVRAWWANKTRDQEDHDELALAHLLTLGTPHQGTWLARFGIGTNTRQMCLHSPWVVQLAHQEPSSHRARTTCYFSACDNVVFPREVATLQGARNIELTAVAHVAMVFHPEPQQQLMLLLAKLDSLNPC